MSKKVLTNLQSLIGEWTISKSIQMTLTARIDKERSTVKHEMQLKIDKIKEDFSAAKVELKQSKATIRDQNREIADLTAKYEDLKGNKGVPVVHTIAWYTHTPYLPIFG